VGEIQLKRNMHYFTVVGVVVVGLLLMLLLLLLLLMMMMEEDNKDDDDVLEADSSSLHRVHFHYHYMYYLFMNHLFPSAIKLLPLQSFIFASMFLCQT
jgi:hypothetical protein